MDLIIESSFYIALLLCVLIPILTIKKHKKVSNKYIPSIVGIVYAIVVVFILAPNVNASGGYSDMITAIAGILLIFISFVTLLITSVVITLRENRKS